jgi:hypothetical protein
MVVIVIMKIVAKITIVVPALFLAIPPFVETIVATLALLAQIFHAIGCLMAMFTMRMDRVVEPSFGLLGITLAFGAVVIGAQAWQSHEHEEERHH